MRLDGLGLHKSFSKKMPAFRPWTKDIPVLAPIDAQYKRWIRTDETLVLPTAFRCRYPRTVLPVDRVWVYTKGSCSRRAILRMGMTSAKPVLLKPVIKIKPLTVTPKPAIPISTFVPTPTMRARAVPMKPGASAKGLVAPKVVTPITPAPPMRAPVVPQKTNMLPMLAVGAAVLATLVMR